jgi:succinate dehydrogenase / fumarate reductase cytochrome b subunit
MYAMALPRTTIGKKIIMAITGLIGVGFIFFHMYGNLKAFLGPAYFNEYAEGLRTLGAPVFGHLHLLTVARLVLLAAVAAHIWAAVTLTRQAQMARPSSYQIKKYVQANYAAVTMRWGGLVLFLFLLYHLAHFTWGVPGIHNQFVRGDAYHNLVSGFQFPPIALIYLAAVISLGFHLYHGGWSMFQTLGLSNENTEKPLRALSMALAVVITIGYLLVPISILIGIIRL